MFLLVKKGCKYFIGYKSAKKIKPLCVFVRKMTAYRKDFDEAKFVCFLLKMINSLKNATKFEIKSVLLSKMNLIVIWHTIKNM